MEAVKAVFFFAFFAVISMFAVSAEFSMEQENSISALFEILSAVYDYDRSLIPDEPNEILALETSGDSRDQLAWAIFKMLRYESDPNSRPINETTPVMNDKQNISATVSIDKSDPNADSQPSDEGRQSQVLFSTVGEQSLTVDSTSESGAVEQPSVVPDILQPWRFKPRAEKQDKVLLTCPSSQINKVMSPGKEAVEPISLAADIAFYRSDGMLLDASVVDITSDVTENTVWDSNSIYHILNPVDVDGAMLVIEPGTTVVFAAGVDAGIRVLNGGVVISRGTAQHPVVFTSDSEYPWYDDYYCALYITETASTATEITYTITEWAYAGVVVLNRSLDKNIENNYFVNCVYGILEYGTDHTPIVNNLCFGSYYSGIEVFMASYSGVEDANSMIHIENNTCDYYQDNGITVHGVTNSDNAGYVFLGNNIVSGSYTAGLNLVDGYMYATVTNTGYYDNAANKNWAFDEYNPVLVTSNPYEMGASGYAPICYLNQSSDFIDAGGLLPEQTHFVGKTTSTTLVPDANVIDLGFHYPNWSYVNAGTGMALGDINEDTITNLDDLILLASHWLEPASVGSEGNLNGDSIVDLTDFAILAASWQKIQGFPNIAASVNISSEDGSIEVQVQDGGAPFYQCFLLIDGIFVKELIFSEDIFQRIVYMPWLSPGPHEARIIGSGQQGIICSAIIPFEIDNAIGPCIVPIMFEMGDPLPFFANSGVNVRVSAWVSGQEIWSQSYPSGMVQGTVPAAVTDANDIEFLLIAPAERSAGGSPVAVPVVSADDSGGDYTALMIRPYMTLNFGSGLADYVYEKLVELGYKVKKLRFYNSSFKNVKKYIDKGTIKVLYYNGHGNYIYPHTDIKRSVVELDDGKIVSDKVSNYSPGQAPSWLDPLPPSIEASVKTWRELNLKDLKFAAFDACKAMRLKINGQGKLEESTSQAYTYRGDLSMALLQRGEFVDQWVFGWADDFVSGFTSPWEDFSITMWEELGKKEDLADAVSEAYSEAPSEVRNAYRLQGHDDPFDFKL